MTGPVSGWTQEHAATSTAAAPAIEQSQLYKKPTPHGPVYQIDVVQIAINPLADMNHEACSRGKRADRVDGPVGIEGDAADKPLS